MSSFCPDGYGFLTLPNLISSVEHTGWPTHGQHLINTWVRDHAFSHSKAKEAKNDFW
jgi:hypothetical protein